jgi:ABC-type Fe3+/spermidine/putrescine transport system ATPase subunit
MRLEIKLLQRRLGISVLFVTHDQIEALSLSDRIAILNNGAIEQIGSPADLYQKPQTAFVRDFLGKTVVLQGIVNRFERDSFMEIRIKGSLSPIFARSHALSRLDIGQSVYLSIRPEDISLIPHSENEVGAVENLLRGTIDALLFHGDRVEVNLRLDGGDSVLCYGPGRFPLKEGQMLAVRLPSELINLWPG